MNDVMLDLETLGTRAGCATLSIGSVGFSTEGLGEEFYCEVNQASCAAYGLFTEQSTLAWWNRQSPEARKVLEATRDEGGLLLPDALSLSSLTSYQSSISTKCGSGVTGRTSISPFLRQLTQQWTYRSRGSSGTTGVTERWRQYDAGFLSRLAKGRTITLWMTLRPKPCTPCYC